MLSIPFPATAAGPVRFSSRDLAVSTAAGAFSILAWFASTACTGIFYTRQVAADLGSALGDADDDVEGKRSKPGRDTVDVGSAGVSAASLDGADLAQTARWLRLAAECGQTSYLISHSPLDPLCPCTLTSCLGRELSRAAALWPLLTAVFLLFTIPAYVVFPYYTALVTLAGYTWHQAWSATLAALFLFVGFTFNFLTPFSSRVTTKNLAVMSIEARLQHRSFAVALAGLVDGFAQAVNRAVSGLPDAEADAADPRKDPEDALHLVLLRTLAPVFRQLFASYSVIRSTTLIALSFEVIGAVMFVAGSSCIPLNLLIGILGWLVLSLIDLIQVARANAHVNSIASLHLGARARIRVLLLRLGSRSPTLRDAMLDQERVLGSALDGAARLRATFAGVTVDTGVVRTVAATVLTLGVGLFGILRGLGVYVTPDNVCGAYYEP
ncbi:hypothetical protein DFJ74DRAFT_686291 [Hyaloraphidium curvatum]|nr:hypothetical protein DFJ74DRAFT_686291 [Hyaloraphidium curvatum]